MESRLGVLMFLELKHIPPTYTGPEPPLYPFVEVGDVLLGFPVPEKSLRSIYDLGVTTMHRALRHPFTC